MRSLTKRWSLPPKLAPRFQLPNRPKPELPVWLATGVAFALAGPALFIPGVIMLFAGGEVHLSDALRLAQVTIASGLWTLASWMAGPFVLRAHGYPSVVARRVEKRWLRHNAAKLVEELHPEEVVLDLAGVHPTSVSDNAPIVLYVLTNRRVLLFRSARLWPFGGRLPLVRSLPFGAIGRAAAKPAGILRRMWSMFDAGRGSGVLELGVLGEWDLRLRFPSLEEAQLAEERLNEAKAQGAAAGPGDLALADLTDDRGALAVVGSNGEAGALSPVIAREKPNSEDMSVRPPGPPSGRGDTGAGPEAT